MTASGRSFFHVFHALRVRLVLCFAAVLTAALLAFGGTVYVAAVIAEAAEQEPEHEKQRELAHIRRLLVLASVLGIPITITAALAGARLLSRQALSSLGHMVRTANSLSLDQLDTRIACDPGAGREIEELVAALNAMLDRIACAAHSLRRFTADAAHELRTPLAVLSSEIEVCLRHPRDVETLRTTLGNALEGLGSLSRLVDVLLTLSRSDAGELPIAPTAVDPVAFITQLAAPFDGVAAERNLTLRIELPTLTIEHPTLHTDPLLLGRAIVNLLDNACKYASAGGTITVTLREAPDAIQVIVSDSGPGMSEHDIEHACDRFYRSPIHRGSTEGFGLGLSLAREFTRILGGTLTLTTAQNSGLVATLTLPRSTAIAKPKEQPKVSMQTARQTALQRIPGQIQSTELEREKGKLVYSFDILDAAKKIPEVQVDAMTREVVSIEEESPEHERAEQATKEQRKPSKP